jgi:hypothetical protein
VYLSDCKNCEDVFTTLESFRLLHLSSIADYTEELEFNCNQNSNIIVDWIRHIVRGVQQAKAKSFAMNQLSTTCGVWLRDWAQKVLPMKFRESQKEYFGKKGMSLHIDVFFFKGTDCVLF